MDAILDLLRVIYEPGAVFERLREKPKILAPLATLMLVTALIQVLMLPYIRAAIGPMLAAVAQQNPQAAATANTFILLGIVIAPIILALFTLIWSGLLWMMVAVVGGEAKFATLFSVATYTGIAFVASLLVVLAIIMVKGKDNLTPQDLQPAIGLDLFITSGGRVATAVLKQINPFSIWGLFLMALGIQVTHKQTKGNAWTAVLVSFVVILLISAGFAAACGRQMGG
jgi:hypothetical protein